MKAFTYKLLLALFPILLLSCSHNNGGPHELYGTWQLESIEVDGKTVNTYQGNFFWKFQADIILIQEVDDISHSYKDHFGTYSYSENNNTLTLNFIHSDNDNPASTGQYAPPQAIFITEPVTVFDIIILKGKTMTLQFTAPSGQQFIYNLSRR